jgi:CheY-like chemotaxis protein
MARNDADAKLILLVEDEAPIRSILRSVLCQGGHVVVEARNGAEALALFKKDHFDLVLTDLEMPEMTGDRLIFEIKELDPFQPIILMTAHRSGLQLMEDIPNAILDKPFPLELLHTAVTTLLVPRV